MHNVALPGDRSWTGPLRWGWWAAQEDGKEATAIAKFNIRNAPTMYLWSIKMECSVMNYAYVDVFDYHVAYYDRLPVFKKVKAVPGTRKLHSITKGYHNTTVNQRVTSCSCVQCRTGTPSPTCGWASHRIQNRTDTFPLCPDCSSPLCVCLDQIERLQEHYLMQGLITQEPGN